MSGLTFKDSALISYVALLTFKDSALISYAALLAFKDNALISYAALYTLAHIHSLNVRVLF